MPVQRLHCQKRTSYANTQRSCQKQPVIGLRHEPISAGVMPRATASFNVRRDLSAADPKHPKPNSSDDVATPSTCVQDSQREARQPIQMSRCWVPGTACSPSALPLCGLLWHASLVAKTARTLTQLPRGRNSSPKSWHKPRKLCPQWLGCATSMAQQPLISHCISRQ